VAGLTFQLAADVLETAIATSWDEVARLAAIAAIRTFLKERLDTRRRDASFGQFPPAPGSWTSRRKSQRPPGSAEIKAYGAEAMIGAAPTAEAQEGCGAYVAENGALPARASRAGRRSRLRR
jgi:hypothetical protein